MCLMLKRTVALGWLLAVWYVWKYIKVLTGLDRESAHPLQLHAMKQTVVELQIHVQQVGYGVTLHHTPH